MAPPTMPKRGITACLLFAALIGGLWAFPSFWYSAPHRRQDFTWLTGRTDIQGWHFKDMPVSESIESTLVADHTENGEFRSIEDARLIRVFCAKRYQDSIA